MANRKVLNENVAEALNQESRLAVTEESRRVINLTCEAVNLVKIDEKLLKDEVANIINKYNDDDKGVFRGIINPFLGIFGLKVVSRKDGSGKKFISDEASQMPVINIDVESLKKILRDIKTEVDSLVDINTRSQARTREMETHLNTAVREAESAKNRLSSQQSEITRSETETLKYIQRMLAERGKGNLPNADEALGQLLEVLGITFSWEPKDDPAAFQIYAISDENKTGVSLPCLLKNDNVAVKGLVYALKSTNE